MIFLLTAAQTRKDDESGTFLVRWLEMREYFGNCQVIEEIGAGGMAVVYRAVQQPLNREVAIKVLKAEVSRDEQVAKRFSREAHFMADMQHENILHVYDYIKEPSSQYIVMEYVNGVDLFDLLEKSVVLPTEVAAIIALQIARALDYAHFRGIVHRDIKPANIIIGKNGAVKLMDFGIARTEELSDLTRTGTGVGTPSYMSPEQILGERLDFRSDMFSLGIVLYQMATGQKPFVEDEVHTVMQKIRTERHQPARKVNRSIPRGLDRIISRCLEKLPVNRYPSTQALIDDLAEFLSEHVTINHNARLVLYLKKLGLLSTGEARNTLEVYAGRSSSRGARDRKLFGHSATITGVALALFFGTAFFLRHNQENPWGSLAWWTHGSGQAGSIAKQGKLKVLADPWARVLVDGKEAFVTPQSEGIPLTIGTHFVRLENPYFEPEESEVEITESRTTTLDVTLERLNTNTEKTKGSK